MDMVVQVGFYPVAAQGLALRYGFMAKLEPDFVIVRALGMFVFGCLFLAFEGIYVVKMAKKTEESGFMFAASCTIYVEKCVLSLVLDTLFLLWAYLPLFSVVRGHCGLQQTQTANTHARTSSQTAGLTLPRTMQPAKPFLRILSRMLHARIFYLTSISIWFYRYVFDYWWKSDTELTTWGFGQVAAMAALAILIFEGYRLLKSTQVPNMLAELYPQLICW